MPEFKTKGEYEDCKKARLSTNQSKVHDIPLPKAPTKKPKQSIRLIALVAVALLIAVGGFRIYYGGGIGLKIVAKNSYSFTDTIVNLDDLLGQPRIVVAIQHPAVKRQLEEMGIIETDEQIKAKIKREIEEKQRAAMKDYKNEMRKIQRQFGY